MFSNDSSPYSNSNYLFIWQDFGFKKIAINTITHLKASRSYCEIHLTSLPMMLVSVSMSEVGKYLRLTNFIRIHRSFIINLQHVDALVGNMAVMANGSRLSISKEYRSRMLRYFCFVGSKSQKFTF
uniref:LytR/AlgR family response regulator transcription factor n=1 Tax=Dysgonomonas sp. TaxID=1891233 RepID=UPI0039E39700